MEGFEYKDLVFEELDKSEMPYQAYYYWNTDTATIRDLLEECEINANDERFSKTGELIGRMVLSIYAPHCFKLELLAEDEHGVQIWADVCFQFTNAAEFIELIPDYGKLRIPTSIE